MKYKLRLDKSTVYTVGSKHMTNNFGEVTVIGRIDMPGNFYLVEFSDGTQVKVEQGKIKKGAIRNPNQPSVCGIGFVGQGEAVLSIGRKTTREYQLWKSMIERCYNGRNKTYNDCTVSDDWKCYNNFYSDIKLLENYDKWLNDDTEPRCSYELDKDIKIEGNKFYSKETCMFVTRRENVLKAREHNNVYVGIRLSDGYTETFNHQQLFALKHGLHQGHVSSCITGDRKSHGGWIFNVVNKA